MTHPWFAPSSASFGKAGRLISFTMLLCAVRLLAAQAVDPNQLLSPDGRIELTFQPPDARSKRPPLWSASFRGGPIIQNGRLGLETVEGGELLADSKVVKESRRSVNEQIPVLFGRSAVATNQFREARYTLAGAGGRPVEVTFRCYNDAVAFRYALPAREGEAGRSAVIRDETTAFPVAGEPVAYIQELENFKTSHEHNVVKVPASEIKPGVLLDLPLTLVWPDGSCAAITEAALRHYAGMALCRTSTPAGADGLVCQLTPRSDGTKVIRPLPLQTPWRVVLIGDRPGALLESETLYCLNDPPSFPDVSWIRPGKITFHWWNGDVYDGQPGQSILSFEMARKYIDFCARSGLPIHSMTSTEVSINPWYHQSQPGVAPGPDTDVTRPRNDFDLPRIREYAQSKGIRLWTWVHQGALRGRVEEAFTAFEKLGWSGMMVDFFDHDDQESIEFAESILEAAARHHILIHFHGVWKPTGWQRTYPNLMNHEGALNLEYLKWSDRCSPEHNLLMAFTRLIAGPMDYHLGGFRAVPRRDFKPRPVAPTVLGTRGHMLAMYVCFDNPSPMVADYPMAYEGQTGFDFVVRVPTWWDDTRVLVGEIGELLVTARRKGSTWYLGAMSAKKTRDLSLPLTFLPSGTYSVRIWRDAPDAESDPNHLVTETLRLSSADALAVHIAVDGGFVAEFQESPAQP